MTRTRLARLTLATWIAEENGANNLMLKSISAKIPTSCEDKVSIFRNVYKNSKALSHAFVYNRICQLNENKLEIVLKKKKRCNSQKPHQTPSIKSNKRYVRYLQTKL